MEFLEKPLFRHHSKLRCREFDEALRTPHENKQSAIDKVGNFRSVDISTDIGTYTLHLGINVPDKLEDRYMPIYRPVTPANLYAAAGYSTD